MDFETIKRDVQDFGHRNNACAEQFRRVLNSYDIHELSNVIKDNFYWCCQSIEEFSSLLKKHEGAFCKEKIYLNTSVKEGFLLAWDNASVEASGNASVEASGNATVRAWDNATVRASDNATVRASGNATVRAWDNATVRAWDNATVEAWDNATVRASGNATVEAWGNATVRASDNATVRASDNATVRASDNATVRASDNASVEAWDNAYILAITTIECKLDGNAIMRCGWNNIILHNSDELEFSKQSE